MTTERENRQDARSARARGERSAAARFDDLEADAPGDVAVASIGSPLSSRLPLATLAPWRFSLLLALALALAACAPSRPPTTSLRLAPAIDMPRNARVTVDDQELGPLWYVTQHGVAMPPGKHRLTIEADGYLPFDAEIDAGPGGGLVKIDVKLVKRPD